MITPTKEQQDIITAAVAGENIAIQAFAGAAKAQPITCKVQTPLGEIALKDIKVGDAIFKTDGSIGKVIGKFPQGVKATYKVTFRDGSFTYCNEEHLWNVAITGSRKNINGLKYETRIFKDIIEYGVRRPSGNYRWQIPLTEPVQYETKDFYLHPYLVGLLIGDGCLVNNTPALSIGINEWSILDELTDFIPKEHTFTIRNTSENCKQLTLKSTTTKTIGCNKIKAEIDRLALGVKSNFKFIPEIYLQGDVEQRIWLLAGLMDSDGSCSNNRTTFNTTSRQLLKDVKYLVQSLGGTAIEHKVQSKERSNCLFTLNIKVKFNPFYNKSKADKWKFSSKNPPSRFITKIEKVEDTEQVCIKVDADNSLYLTDEFIVTHNTTTCVLISKEVKKPSLYLAFNKSIADEAGDKFPFHVESRTIHSLAYEEIIKPSYKMRKKLQNWLDKNDIDLGYLENSPTKFSLKQTIITAIIEFCQSSHTSLEQFVSNDTRFEGLLEDYIKPYWESLINENSSTKITPDIYLKLFQLSKPKLPFSVIYLDEFQDSNPVTLDILFQQLEYKTQIIVVGDKYQSIYEWRGAINGFDKIPEGFSTFYLTESFRFTSKIAEMATKLLYIAGEDKKVVGRAEEKEILTSKAIICRSNSMILSYLLGAYEENKKVYCLADLKDLFSKMYHISSLYFKEKPKFPNSELNRYKDYKQLLAEAEHDSNLERLIKLTVSLSGNGGLHSNITKIKSVLVEESTEANFTLTTAHKSKGLEWDEVTLADDMFFVKDELTTGETLAENQTLNLLYVAITRAKYKVNVSFLIETLIDNFIDFREEYLNLTRD